MKFKHKIMGYAVALTLSLSTASCDFGDMNVNPNAPQDASLTSILPGAQANLMYGIHGDIAQFNSCFTQHLNGVENIYIDVARYDLTTNLASRVWDGNLYPGAMNDLANMIRKADAQNAPYYRGVARVLMASALGQVVDLWNNAPFSESFTGSSDKPNYTPAYQTGAVLYDSVQNLLTLAIADLNATTSVLRPTRDDLFFGGDRAAWTRTARALKARYFNHLSKVDSTGSATRALAEIDAGAFRTNADDARIIFSNQPDVASPWFRFLVGSFGNGLRINTTLADLMRTRNDPRLPFYARTVRVNNRDTIFGAASGVVTTGASAIGFYFNRPESPVNLITFVEQKFIEAEAALRSGNRDRAATAFNAAVRASVEKITASLLNVTPPVLQNTTTNTAYFTANASETAATISLEKIFIEKYIALALDPETWNDWRRSITAATPRGIPALNPAANNRTNGVLPRRWPYPNSEVQTNGANVSAQGAASITDRVFWDK